MQKIIFQIFLFIFSSHFLFSQDTTEVSQENIFPQTDSLSLQNISQDSTKISDSLGLPIIVNESKNELSELSKIIDPEGYRGMHWGMSLNEVKSFIVTLDSTVRENNFFPITNGFEYTKRISDASATISYQFDYDRLYIIRIKLNLKSATKFNYLEKYDEMNDILSYKYGKSTRSGYHKTDDTYLSTIESVILGFAKKYTLWEFERSIINLMLTGKNRQLEIKITYGSKPIIYEMKERKEILKYDDF